MLLLSCEKYGLRGIIKLLVGGEVFEGGVGSCEFDAKLWTFVKWTFCNYQLGVILLDWSRFFSVVEDSCCGNVFCLLLSFFHFS